MGQYATRVTRESETSMIFIMPAHTVLGDPGDCILYIMYYILHIISNILHIIYYVGGGSLISITCLETQHLPVTRRLAHTWDRDYLSLHPACHRPLHRQKNSLPLQPTAK